MKHYWFTSLGGVLSRSSVLFVLCLSLFGHPSLSIGQSFRIDVRYPHSNDIGLAFNGLTSSYYQIQARASLSTGDWIKTDLRLGSGGVQSWTGLQAVAVNAAMYYRVKCISLSAPEDTDGDGMDDVCEMTQPLLDALDPADAAEDIDGDGFSNLSEYEAGTDMTDPLSHPVADMYSVTLGVADSSGDEFRQPPFSTDPVNVDTQTVAAFPKELNNSWWNTLYVNLTLSEGQASRDLLVTLNPFWNDGSGALTVALEVLAGSEWIEVDRAAVSATVDGTLTVPAWHLVTGLNRFRLRTISGSSSTSALVWDQIIIQSGTRPVYIVLGEEDNSDYDFKQSAYPTNPVDLNVQHAIDFPKELNDTWWPVQRFLLRLDVGQISRDLNFTLKPYWSDGSGNLNVALDVLSGTNWFELDRTSVNATTNGLLVADSSALKLGTNQFRFRVVGNIGTTHIVTWDQIVIERGSGARAFSAMLGTANNSDLDFKQSAFLSEPVDLDVQQVADFPKEVNLSWWPAQRFCFQLNEIQAAKDMACTLRPAWSDGAGALTVAVDAWDGTVWTEMSRAEMNGTVDGVLAVPASELTVGRNDLRFRAVSGSNSTQVVTWDQIWIRSHSVSDYMGASLAVADMDVDLVPDIVVGSTASNAADVSVYGTSGVLRTSFTAYSGYKVGVNVAVGDVNNDGYPEIVTGPAGSGYPAATLKVFSAAGVEITNFDVAAESLPIAVAVGDVDGDGVKEIVAGVASDWIFIYEGNGTPVNSFQIPNPYSPYGVYAGQLSIAAGDVNFDGTAEIVASVILRNCGLMHSYYWSVFAKVFDAGGGLLSQFTVASQAPNTNRCDWPVPVKVPVAAGDVDGDGRADIIMGSDMLMAGAVRIYNSDGAAKGSVLVPYPNDACNVSIAAGDIDGDGKAEVLVPEIDVPPDYPVRIFNPF